MLEISHVLTVCVYEHEVERSRDGREGLEGFCRTSEDDIDLVDKTCGGEVLGCNLDTMGVHV